MLYEAEQDTANSMLTMLVGLMPASALRWLLKYRTGFTTKEQTRQQSGPRGTRLHNNPSYVVFTISGLRPIFCSRRPGAYAKITLTVNSPCTPVASTRLLRNFQYIRVANNMYCELALHTRRDDICNITSSE